MPMFKYYFNDSNLLNCFNEEDNCQSKGYAFTKKETKECFNVKEDCIQRGYKIFNNECLEECPENTEDKNDICLCTYNFINDNNLLNCFNENDNCISKGYSFLNIETKECFRNKEDCIQRGYKIFNNECYNICPQNTEEKNRDSICLCSYNFINDNDLLNCFNEEDNCQSKGYAYTNKDTKECFNTKEDCIQRGYKIFNNECYDECPLNSEDKNNNNICFCSYNYYIKSNSLDCFNEAENCKSKRYDYANMDTKECFDTKEDCIDRGYKIFNKECYNECPLNSEDKNNNNICECSYYFYNNSGILNCFNQGKTCLDEEYLKESFEYNECFNSYEDCISKGYFYYYNQTCFKNDCPSGTIPLGSLNNNKIKVELINQLNLLDNSILDRLCICDTFYNNTYYGWMNDDSNPSLQICLHECPQDYEFDAVTHR